MPCHVMSTEPAAGRYGSGELIRAATSTKPNATQADMLQADVEEESELFWVVVSCRVMSTQPNSTQADMLQAEVEEVTCSG